MSPATQTLGDFLWKLTTFTDPNVAPINDFRRSLAHLKTVSSAGLQRSLAGALDLCAHRLDAWITSFATKRLDTMRKTAATGIYFGGYGWVENLTAAPAAVRGRCAHRRAGADFSNAGRSGFCSCAVAHPGGHSRTAAQRASHAFDRGSARPARHRPFFRARPAGELSARRRPARPAARRLARLSLRASPPRAGAGSLHRGFPQGRAAWRKLENTNQPVEAIAANNVVDGLELRRRWDEVKDNPDASAVFLSALNPAPSTAERTTAQERVECTGRCGRCRQRRGCGRECLPSGPRKHRPRREHARRHRARRSAAARARSRAHAAQRRGNDAPRRDARERQPGGDAGMDRSRAIRARERRAAFECLC